MSPRSLGLSLFVSLSLLACGAKPDESSATATKQAPTNTASNEDGLLTESQLEALRRTQTIDKVFVPTAGSSGKGEIMSELKASGGVLLDPLIGVDVYDTASPHSPQELKKKIQESLDRDRMVLIDNGGVTPEDRKNAAAISFEAIGANVDAAGAMITKAPPEKGGGYLLTPIYSRADVQAQVASGQIPNAEAQSNTPQNLFIHKPENPTK